MSEERAELRTRGEAQQATIGSLTADRDAWRQSSEENGVKLSTSTAEVEASRAAFEQQAKALMDRDQTIVEATRARSALRSELDQVQEEFAKATAEVEASRAAFKQQAKALTDRDQTIAEATQSTVGPALGAGPSARGVD